MARDLGDRSQFPQNVAAGQYPISDAARWRRIVKNLAAVVRELDRGFAPKLEKAGRAFAQVVSANLATQRLLRLSHCAAASAASHPSQPTRPEW
jgi:hypothetical protein